jgi:pentatricopeptide repeat protein
LGPLFTARRGFLSDEDAEWIREIRHELDALRVRALECYAQSCLGVGGTELAAAERAGQELTKLAPYRESGYRHLMQALARTGNTAEALRVYEQLRIRLREELGTAPSHETLALHERLIRAGASAPR